jgi:hypothetical protein
MDSDYTRQLGFISEIKLSGSLIHHFVPGLDVHFCHAISQFDHGAWFARRSHKIRDNQSDSHSVDLEYLPSVICYWTPVYGSLVGNVWPCMGA